MRVQDLAQRVDGPEHRSLRERARVAPGGSGYVDYFEANLMRLLEEAGFAVRSSVPCFVSKVLSAVRS